MLQARTIHRHHRGRQEDSEDSQSIPEVMSSPVMVSDSETDHQPELGVPTPVLHAGGASKQPARTPVQAPKLAEQEAEFTTPAPNLHEVGPTPLKQKALPKIPPPLQLAGESELWQQVQQVQPVLLAMKHTDTGGDAAKPGKKGKRKGKGKGKGKSTGKDTGKDKKNTIGKTCKQTKGKVASILMDAARAIGLSGFSLHHLSDSCCCIIGTSVGRQMSVGFVGRPPDIASIPEGWPSDNRQIAVR